MPNLPKQVMDIRVQKGFNAREGNEHQRNWDDKKWGHAASYGTYDRTRSKLNFEIVKGRVQPIDTSKSIPDRISESLRSRGIKDPNEGLAEPKYRTVVNFIFGGNRDRMHEISFGKQQVNLNKDADNSHITRSKEVEDWAKDVYDFVAQKWGEDNIASFVVHLDETNPHIHCTLLPIRDGKFAYKKIFAGSNLYEYRDRTIKLHDDFAVAMEKWGLFRGSDITKTGARNIPPHEYRRLLSRECLNLEEQIDYNKTLLRQLQKEVAHGEKRVKGLTTMITNLEQKKVELEQEMTEISAQIQAGQGDSIELQKHIEKLSAEYEKTLGSLTDKRQKLTEANRKLAELRQLEDESKEKADEYRAQAEDYQKSLRESSADMTRQVQFRIADAAVSQAIVDLKRILPPDVLSHESLDGSFIRDLAEHGDSFLKCAAMLFVGYVNGATTIAQNCGGGGTSSDLPWGRDDDDDDRRWAMKCLAQASKMMRPSTGKSVKRK